MDEGLGVLQRWTVVTLLGLLAVVTIAEIIDAFVFANIFNADPALYAVIGGMVTGLFTVEAVGAFTRRSRNGKGGKDGQDDGR